MRGINKRSIKTIGSLHKLPFGDQYSSLIRDIHEAEKHFAKVVPTLQSLRSAEDDKTFFYKFAGMSFNRISIAATSATQLIQSCGVTEDYILTIPIEDCGDSNCAIDGSEFFFSAKRFEALFFAPSKIRTGMANSRSAVTIRFSEQALLETLRLMTGNPDLDAAVNTKVVTLGGGVGSPLHYLSTILASIDAVRLDIRKANILSIDDVILRFVSYISFPEFFSAEAAEGNSENKDALDLVCDAIRTRLSSPLSLSEMQILSGLNARNLQRKFIERFGCSPLEWQKRERLYFSRNRLLTASEDLKITNLALEAGFASPSRFIACYRDAFNETPGQTLLRRSSR